PSFLFSSRTFSMSAFQRFSFFPRISAFSDDRCPTFPFSHCPAFPTMSACQHVSASAFSRKACQLFAETHLRAPIRPPRQQRPSPIFSYVRLSAFHPVRLNFYSRFNVEDRYGQSSHAPALVRSQR